MVLVSSDKAVRPTNIMGATKRISEQIIQVAAKEKSNTIFSIVRFGNVVESSGSVIPLFRAQILQGGPLTITDRKVCRYFMAIEEAVQLVLYSSKMATGGEVFLLDMGEPINIFDMAIKLIASYGLTERTAERPFGDIEIKFTGLRPGEKMVEELLISGRHRTTDHPKIFVASEKYPSSDVLWSGLNSLTIALDTRDENLLIAAIQGLVPEYTPSKNSD